MSAFGITAMMKWLRVIVLLAVRRRITVAESLLLLCPGILMTLFFSTVNTEYRRATEATFYGSDLQITVGIDCINDTVMYRVMDSVRKVKYPLQVFNENTYGGELNGKMSCHDGVFRDADDKALSRDTVLARVTRNVITGYLPWTSGNTGNHTGSQAP